ncbi:protein of unknown function [Candidatus Nitrosocosmicus franklandus]|uniref:Uncharacterized protein n=1 Tax=Candidatus Nitrosocosmicus franklandianus TaxID=1798806 RepID=A0A484IDS9_9ARCH|nr:protein of unknown function [Candidatus Nitrosocosmicus franklandus]
MTEPKYLFYLYSHYYIKKYMLQQSKDCKAFLTGKLIIFYILFKHEINVSHATQSFN